ncbi:hypothetical protein [Kitasatospora sp. NPDC058046]|uniref:hypothetical protein n=1 Tax=Kitasatospora sp. NPDC058046 TaxID=3346312 RepID=UPI0036DA127E
MTTSPQGAAEPTPLVAGVRVAAPCSGARLTPAQRSGTACIGCGSSSGPLTDAGHVSDDGLVYAVGVCAACPPYAASLEAHQ